jgi:GT2 family glycosyltransferase
MAGTPYNLTVWDNNSIDESKNFLRAFQPTSQYKYRVIFSEENKGIGRSVNEWFDEYCKSDWFIRIDDDILSLTPHWLDNFCGWLENVGNEKIAYVSFPRHNKCGYAGEPKMDETFPDIDRIGRENGEIFETGMGGGQPFAVRSEFFKENKFREDKFVQHIDTEYTQRVLDAGWKHYFYGAAQFGHTTIHTPEVVSENPQMRVYE